MMLLSKAASAMNGRLLGADAEFLSVGTDSRKIAQDELFFAIKGEKFDGHEYAEQALRQGAVAVVVDDETCLTRPAILVEDTLLALGQLAKSWRSQFNVPVISVTGSNGKTTIKEMISAILVAKTGNPNTVHATLGNLNNHIGLPLTLLKLRTHHQYAVLEMGMNHLGEINYLTHIARPTVAVVANAGTAHIGELGSRDNIAKAKGEIYAGLNSDGVAVINADDDYAEYWETLNSGRRVVTFGLSAGADVNATYQESNGLTLINLSTPSGAMKFNLHSQGKHNVSNALAASAVAYALGISNDDIARGLESFAGVNGRLQKKSGLNNAVVIDDTYNANPDSMRAAIDVLATHIGKKIMVMGDMAELGTDAAELHAGVGAYAKQKGINVFYTFGQNSHVAAKAFGAEASAFETVELLINAIKSKMDNSTVVLVKGSRFMKMERVVNAIIQHPIVEGAH